MNCVHCAKGEAEEQTITKDVVDKTFENLKEHKICNISFFGGEPTLEPEMCLYIMDKIIEKKINVMSVNFSTNGLIFSKQIALKLNELGRYIVQNNKQRNPDFIKHIQEYDFKNKTYAPCIMTISTYYHADNENIAYKGYELYKQYQSQYFRVEYQTEEKESSLKESGKELLLIHMGNAVNNFNMLKKESGYRIKDKFGAMRRCESKFVDLPIYICVNGNVSNSDLVTYHLEDTEYCLGNILKEDLFEMMDRWNFEHPLSHKQRKNKQWCLTEIFNYENGITQIYKKHPEYVLTEDMIKLDKEKLKFYDYIEDVMRKVHKQYPYLFYDEVWMVGSLIIQLQTKGCYFNSDFSGMDYDATYKYNEKTLKAMIQDWENIHNERKILMMKKEIKDGWNTLLSLFKNAFKGDK